jgi:hypothetical protein
MSGILYFGGSMKGKLKSKSKSNLLFCVNYLLDKFDVNFSDVMKVKSMFGVMYVVEFEVCDRIDEFLDIVDKIPCDLEI